MSEKKSIISSGQYSLFRGLFGLYLLVHFVHLLPWAVELFSSKGMIAVADASPLFGILPSPLMLSDSPAMVLFMLVSAAVGAVAFTLGYKDKWAAIWMLYVLACIFARNPLIANPALPYVGWMLLAHLFVPGKPYGSLDAKGDLSLAKHWFMPQAVFIAGVAVLALTYSYSGYTKLLSPSWVSGDTIHYVLQNPLARDHLLNTLLLALPPITLKLLTWFILYIELLYAVLVLVRGLHKWVWTSMLLVQFGFLFLLNFPDLTVAMLLMHLFTFNPQWLKAIKASLPETVYYDGDCGFCHGCVKFLLAEDKGGHLRFSPLGSNYFNQAITHEARFNLPISLVVQCDDGRLKTKSAAVAHCLKRLGGVWRALAVIIDFTPKVLADFVYDQVGKVRRRIVQAPEGLCPILAPELAKRFV